MLKLANPNSYPFGLLNNNAITPFTLNGRIWSSVSEYVYINMFKDPDMKNAMKDHLVGGNQYEAMLNLKRKKDEEVYRNSLLKALKRRFFQYPRLRAALRETRGKEIVYVDADIALLLNNIRSDANYLFDPLRGVDVPRKEVLAVIAGVEQELLRNPRLPDLVYADLIKYASNNPVDIPPGDRIFLDINNIVPVLKRRLKARIWENEIERFKPHLLDVYLDHILENEYPHVHVEDYREAKRQQYEKEGESSISHLKNQLFTIYEEGNAPQFILEKLQFVPDQSVKDILEEEDPTPIPPPVPVPAPADPLSEIMALMDTNTKSDKFILDASSPFLPHFLEMVEIDGGEFASATHYAYFEMIQQYGGTTFSINEVPLNDLDFVYQEHKNTWVFETLKSMNENATIQKLTEHPSLVFLLLATKHMGELVYDDPDTVLGSRGDNMAGRFLTHLRNERIPAFMNPTDQPASTITLDDIWMSMWFKNTAKDYRNSLQLLKRDNVTASLSRLYGRKPAANNGVLVSPTNADVARMKKIGFSDEETRVVFPFIVAEYEKLTKGVTTSAMFAREAQISAVLNKHATAAETRVATQTLMDIYKSVTPRVSADRFVASFLANRLTTNPADALNWKIKKLNL
jgi:hypothetical protein